MLAVQTQRLTKTFGKMRALNELNFEVKQGETHGFLGPNGAGKSTTIRVLIGALKRDGGGAKLFGGDVWRDAEALHKRLVYVPGDVRLWPNLTGGEVIDLLGKLRSGFSASKRKEYIERFHLDPTKKCRSYSTGNLQKVALVSAFASDVDLYLFDEPTSGLDPLMEAVFTQSVLELKKAGKTVLLSSHILAEVEALCDRISIIRDGKIVESGTLVELRHLTRSNVTVSTAKPVMGLETLSGVHDLNVDGNTSHFQVDDAEMSNVMRNITGYEILSLVCTPPTLEELFLRHYGDQVPRTASTKGGV